MRKRMKALVAVFLAAILVVSQIPGPSAQAASSDEIQQQIDQLKEDQKKMDELLADLEGSLAQNNNDLKNMVARKDGIDQQIALLYTQIQNVSQQLSAFNLLIADKQEELDMAEKRLQQLQDKYKDRIRAMEEQGSLSYWMVIIEATDFANLLDRLGMVVEIASSDRIRLKQLKEAAAQVAEGRQQLAQEKVKLEESKRTLEASQAAMEAKRAEADQLLMDMKAKGDEFEIWMDDIEQQLKDFEEELVKKEDEYDEAKYQEWLATSVPPTTTRPGGLGTGNDVDGIVWYVPTQNFLVTSTFGNRWHPIHHEWRWHNGIDMAAPSGTPVYATRTGVVTVAAYEPGGAGWYVKINHGDGFVSVYMHMTHFIVEKGQYVSAGEIIGYVGSTGGSTGPHLHFGIAYMGLYKDPLQYIKIK